MLKTKIFVLLPFVLTLGITCSLAQESGQKSVKTETEKWREDLRYMAEQMPLVHKNLFHTMSREQFDAAVKKLDDRIPSLARHQIIVELARIVAMVEDGHTNLRLAHDPEVRFHTLPLNLYLFRDELFIRSANREYSELVGAQIVRIGNVPVNEAITRVRSVIGRDNEMDIKFFAPYLFVKPEILHALNIADTPEQVRFTIKKDGKQQVVVIKPTNSTEVKELDDTDTSWITEPGWADMRDRSTAPTPLWLKDINNKFWFEFLPDSKVLYVQVNEVGDKKEETLTAFSKRLLAFADANPVDKLVLDLRLNRGGNNTLFISLIRDIIRSRLDQRGKFFTIIGRSTWSAAQNLINELEKYTNTLFVGEPSGSKGNTYGDSRRITLPNSKIVARVSVYYWQDWYPWDSRDWTAPDLTAELSPEDYKTNSDPAMKVILNYTPEQSLNESLTQAMKEGGVDLAIKRFREFKMKPINRYADTEQPILEFVSGLLNEKKNENAAKILSIYVEENPRVFQAFYALGEAYFRAGKKDLAIANFEKALQLRPKNNNIAERLKQARKM
jgi:tetratricopeptide (TPR) repeat protein